MKTLYIKLLVLTLFFTSCHIEEEYTLSESILGKWSFSGRTAFYKDGSSSRNLPQDACEYNYEFILYEDGKLFYEDYKQKDYLGGDSFCEQNTLTAEDGFWILNNEEQLRFLLKNSEDDSDIIIPTFHVESVNIDQLNIRYNEYENEEDESIAYYVYHYFRIYE